MLYDMEVDDVFLQYIAKRVAKGVQNGEDMIWSIDQYPELDRENREKVKILVKKLLKQNECSL